MQLDSTARLYLAVAPAVLLDGHPSLTGSALILADSVVSQGLLTSALVFREKAHIWSAYREELTRDVPGLCDDERATLDSRGIVRLGATARYGNVLVGRVRETS